MYTIFSYPTPGLYEVKVQGESEIDTSVMSDITTPKLCPVTETSVLPSVGPRLGKNWKEKSAYETTDISQSDSQK